MLTLTYFACRARGQALRLFLADSGVEWRNVVAPFGKEWVAVKAGPQYGTFSMTPVLEVDRRDGKPPHVFNETLAIAAFLSRNVNLQQGSCACVAGAGLCACCALRRRWLRRRHRTATAPPLRRLAQALGRGH
jgi:hypothetical protein